MQKVAVYTGSRNIYEDMLTCAKSLLVMSDVDKIYFLTEDDDIPMNYIDEIIEIRNVSNQEYFHPWGPNMKTRFTYFAMMRAALAKEFPDLDYILSLDCDTVCVRDVSHIWELPVDDCYFAAAIEPHRSIAGLKYTNAGVALMNLHKQRETGKVDEYIDVLNRQGFSYVDQDVMNYLSQGYIYEMNSEYNANSWTKPTSDPRIIHFAGIKRDEWHKHPKYKEYKDMTWGDVLVKRKQNHTYPS